MTFVPERYERTEVLVFQEVGKCSFISNNLVGWLKCVGRIYFSLTWVKKAFGLDLFLLI